MNIHKHAGNSIHGEVIYGKEMKPLEQTWHVLTQIWETRESDFEEGEGFLVSHLGPLFLFWVVYISAWAKDFISPGIQALFLGFDLFILFYVWGILPSHIHVHNKCDMCARCHWGEKDVIVPGTGVKNESLRVGAGNLNHVTNDPTLQSQDIQTLVT